MLAETRRHSLRSTAKSSLPYVNILSAWDGLLADELDRNGHVKVRIDAETIYLAMPRRV